ncbi:thiamine diphosphokinase [Listeria costaricensis]|uniref:thiamine diphosphokinase n=1 Tax=Listeria costaricensis TaxID=2026604 RepID=UPI000C06DAAE|nr:thiamine diphosphokinase [Listeria costaricensis]
MIVIHIMVGGPETELPDLTPYQNEAAIWLGVDRGAIRLLKRSITPDKAMGDFDSITKAELADLKKKVADVELFPAEKDETDTEIGLGWALKQAPDKIRIFGATGGRIDHLLVNLMMLLKPRFKQAIPLVEIIDRYNYIRMYEPGTYQVQKRPEMKYVAFTTMTDVTGLTLRGFKYPLEEADYPAGSPLSSNEFTETEGLFSFKSGLILYTESRD